VNCDGASILNFFNNVALLLNRDPRLILNMDETSVNAKKRFKVLTAPDPGHVNHALPITVQVSKFPHLTGCITVTAAGKLFDPLIILPNLKSLKSLKDFAHYASFATSVTGWMNTELFLVWTIDIIAQISWYRERELPAHLRDEWIIVILDGHVSRLNFEANLLLHEWKMLVIILPGHTTHVLQAIDVGLTGPLKSAFKQKLDEITHPTILDADGHVVQAPLTQVSADRGRWMLVKSFIHGSQASCTMANITSAFDRSGLCPFDVNKPFNTGYVTDPATLKRLLDKSSLDPGNVRAVASVNGGILSSDEGIRALAERHFRRPITPNDLALSPIRIEEMMHRIQVGRGKDNVLLTPVRPILYRQNGQLAILWDRP
jgi:hypothetical protein